MSAADAAVVDQLRNLSSGKYDRIVGNKKDRTIIDAFYSGRDYAPLWITDGKVNERGKAVIAYLGHVDQDGLDPADYPVPNFSALSEPGDLAEAELKLDMTIITYAHHASVGRVHWSRVSADIYYTLTAPEPADVLAAMVEAKDMAKALDAYEPRTAGYLALKAKLAEIRAGKMEAKKSPVANGAAPKVGASDDRVPLLRERLERLRRRHHLRQGAGRRGEEVPAGAQAQGHRHADPADHRRAQRPPRRTSRSTSSSPTWSAGAGCRTISATPT